MNYSPKEIEKLRQTIGSKWWRLTNLYKILDKNRRLVNLNPNAIQLQMRDDTKEEWEKKKPLREFFLKYRQGGVSTFWLLWWLDETISTKNTITAILSHKQESLKYLWEIVRRAYENMPPMFKPKYDKFNESELSFPEINSKIFVSLSIRSTAVHNLHISELCFIDANDIRASLASVGPEGNITAESTANGIGNEGYEMYQEAKTMENGFRAHFYPWWIQPEYRIELNGLKIHPSKEEAKLPLTPEQILWRRITKKNQGPLFPQEFPESDDTAFLTTGNPYFDNQKIMALLRELKDLDKERPPIEETYDYVMWAARDKTCLYAAGADVAEGIDGDWSVLSIINVTTRELVFRYRARVGVDEFYKVCDHWCRYYMNALLAVERNNHGHAVLLGLYETKRYPNLFVQDQDMRVVKVRGISEPKKIVKLGWETTTVTKPMMMDQLKLAVEGSSMDDVEHFQPEFLMRDKIFLQEALTIQALDNKISAVSGKNDDTVISMAIAFQMYMKLRSKAGHSFESRILVGDSMQATGLRI